MLGNIFVTDTILISFSIPTECFKNNNIKTNISRVTLMDEVRR